MTIAAQDNKIGTPSPDKILHKPLDSLNIELSGISAAIRSINSGFQAQMQQVVAQLREAIENEYRARMEKSLSEIREQVRSETEEELRKTFEAERSSRNEHLDRVEKEVERVRSQIEGVTKDITAMLDDPSVELSRLMRKHTEQSELKAYLDGLIFSIGDPAQAR